MHAIEDKETQHPPSPAIFLAHLNNNSPITVIYDGECRFCLASVNWLALDLEFKSLPFQSADLAPFNLTREECAKEVITILDGTTVRGAAAVAALLRARGDRVLATAISASGFIGRYGYRWIATHRNSSLIKFSTYLLECSVNKRA
jgi:predicted DCC family thiol-disulfide oxidoreductase YuxK